ncbi:MAG: proline dehydrogenase family protein [bacterium]
MTKEGQETSQAMCRLAKELWQESKRSETIWQQLNNRLTHILIKNKKIRDLMISMSDQIFRCTNTKDIAKSLIHKLKIPRFLKKIVTIECQLYLLVIKTVMGRYMKKFIQSKICKLKKFSKEGFIYNYNIVGERALCQADINEALKGYITLIKDKNVGQISIKLSAITLPRTWIALQERIQEATYVLEILASQIRPRQSELFMTIDMEHVEEYEVTLDAIKNLCLNKKNRQIGIGIVIQAYLENAFELYVEVQKLSRKRQDLNGKALKIRLVKGANWVAEKQLSSTHHWPNLTYQSKEDTDTQFKRIVNDWCENGYKNCEIGVATHNIFEIALALVLRKKCPKPTAMSIEMLHGMNPALAKVVQKRIGPVISYRPLCHPHKQNDSIPYFLRRLDEQSGSKHFMKVAFTLLYGSNAWIEHEQDAIKSLDRCYKDIVVISKNEPSKKETFENEALNTWIMRESQKKVGEIIKNVQQLQKKQRNIHAVSIDVCMKTIKRVKAAQKKWQKDTWKKRQACIERLAINLRKEKVRLIAEIMAEVGKPLIEADAEVGEAIDFCHYYAQKCQELYTIDKDVLGKGLVCVASPWNFPVAITCSGMVAALLTGNGVIIKASPRARNCANTLVEIAKKSRVPEDILETISLDEQKDGKELMRCKQIDKVVLTGSSETAEKLIKWRPDIDLQAETGGKNCMIITEMADQDQAISDILHSAFSYSGQKCSAASILIITKPLWRQKNFLQRLKEATRNLVVDVATNPAAQIVPLIRADNTAFLNEVNTLEKGQSWLLKPKQHPALETLWSAGIKVGIRPEHHFFHTECFAPLLGVMIVKDIHEAIKISQQTSYGLTAGLHSLSDYEQDQFIRGSQAGNVYINRPITGAMVGRQPFGGWKKSSYGSQSKVGGAYTLWDMLQQSPQVKIKQKSQKLRQIKAQELLLTETDRNELEHELDQAAEIINMLKNEHPLPTIRGEENRYDIRPYTHIVIKIDKIEDRKKYLLIIGISGLLGSNVEVWNPHNDKQINWFMNQVNKIYCVKHVNIKKIRPNTLFREIRPENSDLKKEKWVMNHLSKAENNSRIISKEIAKNRFSNIMDLLEEQVICKRLDRYGRIE